MFKRVLIANRGEIALRAIRCLRERDIESVIAYSKADEESLPVMFAAYSVCIGDVRAQDSYLNIERLIDAAKGTNCDAVFPGYGFLSENPEFARRCAEENLVFIGPSAEVIKSLGDKQTARKLMMSKGIPVVPGTEGLIPTYEQAQKAAAKIGYPVLIKATAGGGGKGMRRAYCEEELKTAYETARAEAKENFGNDEVYIEKLIVDPHHIEIQILGDVYGNVIYLGERDCSVQKNNQKILEESPAKMMTPALRKKMGETAVRAAKAAGYYSAGTVEFVVDKSGRFYFIEMNTRIQVEHPVTELVTGIDLIYEQLRIAAGMRLGIKQKDVLIRGHAIECRINAASAGVIRQLHFPAGYGVRVDSHLYQGYEVTPFYDGLIAKIIVHGSTRLEAVRRMRRCLEECIIDGVDTNVSWLHLLMYHPEIMKGTYNTSFWDKNKDTLDKWYQEGLNGKDNEGARQ